MKTDWRFTIKGVGYTFYNKNIEECLNELKLHDYKESDISIIEQVNVKSTH